MRTTIRIDDNILAEIKKRASERKESFTQTANRVLRAGLLSGDPKRGSKKRFRQKTYDMGTPRVDLTKALSLAAELEDREIARKMSLRK